jgi:flavin-dependent dehydrogenase
MTVTEVDLDEGTLTVRDVTGDITWVAAKVIVGADGLRSVVARSAGAARPVRLAPRVGLTYHLEDRAEATARDARMCVFRDGYVGIAPVPGGRVNVGIVLGKSWLPALRRDGAETVAGSIVQALPATPDDPGEWRLGRRCDSIEGVWPLGHRVTQRGGPGWLLIGDAAGFLDPFTGEGLHRALVSADLAARAILAAGSDRPDAFAAYDRVMRRRFMAKDVVSWLVQLFLARPAMFEYAARRVASRDALRATMGLVMGDLVPASRALNPRYLAALLAP